MFTSSSLEAKPISMEQTVREVFALLRQKGPLCASQISVELLLPIREITEALQILRQRGRVAPRIDRRHKDVDELCAIWGLPLH